MIPGPRTTLRMIKGLFDAFFMRPDEDGVLQEYSLSGKDRHDPSQRSGVLGEGGISFVARLSQVGIAPSLKISFTMISGEPDEKTARKPWSQLSSITWYFGLIEGPNGEFVRGIRPRSFEMGDYIKEPSSERQYRPVTFDSQFAVCEDITPRRPTQLSKLHEAAYQYVVELAKTPGPIHLHLYSMQQVLSKKPGRVLTDSRDKARGVEK